MQHEVGAEQQLSRTTPRISPYSKRVVVSGMTREQYVDVFLKLTHGTGNVVKPSQNIDLLRYVDLKAVMSLHGIRAGTKYRNKEDKLQMLVGKELWNPFTPPPDTMVPQEISEEEMLEDIRALGLLRATPVCAVDYLA